MISDFDAFLKGLIQRKTKIWKSYVCLFPKPEGSEETRRIVETLLETKEEIIKKVSETESGMNEIDKRFKRIEDRIDERVD